MPVRSIDPAEQARRGGLYIPLYPNKLTGYEEVLPTDHIERLSQSFW